MQYTIQAVSQQTRSYETKFGPMTSYKLKLEGHDVPVELGQKASSPAPRAGQTIDGHIEDGPYGPKFKKEYAQGGFGGQSSSGPSGSGMATNQTNHSKGGKEFDSFTMYLSYAKDVAVALITTKEGFNEDVYAKVLDSVITGGKTLYDNRPGAEPAQGSTPSAAPAQPPQQDTVLSDEFDGSEPIDLSQIPF